MGTHCPRAARLERGVQVVPAGTVLMGVVEDGKEDGSMQHHWSEEQLLDLEAERPLHWTDRLLVTTH